MEVSSSAAGFGQRTQAVDWEAVDEELFHMAPEFKDPRFDSLHHVLSILGAVDSEAALDEVLTVAVPEPHVGTHRITSLCRSDAGWVTQCPRPRAGQAWLLDSVLPLQLCSQRLQLPV